MSSFEELIDLTNVLCAHCGARMVLRGKFYSCSGWPKCNYSLAVGKESTYQLRAARKRGHILIDTLVLKHGWTRSQVYAHIRNKMKIPGKECHFGSFNLSDCLRAIDILRSAIGKDTNIRRIAEQGEGT